MLKNEHGFFKPEDLRDIRDPLARLLRVIFITRGITRDQMLELHHQKHADAGQEKRAMATDRNNLRRAILDERITWGKIRDIIIGLLRLKLKSVAVTVIDPLTGQEITYSSDDDVTNLPKEAPPQIPLPF